MTDRRGGHQDPRTRREDGRALDELRPVSFERDFTEFAAGIGARDHGPDQGALHRLARGAGAAAGCAAAARAG